MYQVFTRAWWRREKGRLVPDPGAEKTYLEEYETEAEARAACKEWNEENEPGPLSIKAEYQES